MKEVKLGMVRGWVRSQEEWRLPGLKYADDLVMCGESEEDLRIIAGRFIGVSMKRGLKINASKSKVMLLGGLRG